MGGWVQVCVQLSDAVTQIVIYKVHTLELCVRVPHPQNIEKSCRDVSLSLWSLCLLHLKQTGLVCVYIYIYTYVYTHTHTHCVRYKS